MTEKLAETARHIQEEDLPEVIQQCQQAMTNQYHKEMATLRANLGAIDTADDPQAIQPLTSLTPLNPDELHGERSFGLARCCRL